MNGTLRAMGGMGLRTLEVVMWATFLAIAASVALCVVALGIILLVTVLAAAGIVAGCVHVIGATE